MDTNAEKPKRGPGKPSKGDDGRCVSVTVKVTRNEYVAWKAEAKAQGMTFTGFLLEPRRRERARKQAKEKI
jgi:hypothetical protein